jgi:hypothetical protein
MLMTVRVLVCEGCEEHIVLPHGTPSGISQDQWYWPTDNPILTFACLDCGHLSGYSRQETRLAEIQTPNPNQRASVFWRAEFSCALKSCGLPIVVHTRSEAGIPPAELEAGIRAVAKSARCANGDFLTDEAEMVSCDPIDWRE